MKRNLFIFALILGLMLSLFTITSLAAEEGEDSSDVTDCCEHTVISPVEEIPAECNSVGTVAHFACDECKETFTDELGLNPVTAAELEIPALSHSYTAKSETEDYVKDAGDCSRKIVYWYACEHCGGSAGADADASDKFYESETVGHTFSDKWTTLDGEHWRGCTQIGCQAKTDAGEHTFEAEAFSHKEKDGHAHVCTVCGYYGELLPHNTESKEPTETDPVCCADCGYIVTPALNHKDNHEPKEEWTFDENAHWHECEGCEGQQLDYRIHIDKDKDGFCDSCTYPVTPDPTPDPIEDKLLELTEKLTKQQVIYVIIGAVSVVILAIIIQIVSISRKRRKW
ncbi:MAG: hypothetical protein IKL79_06825 [Clostridia bacterium]|nr:hypothetical protein [Clostridia bacterium]